MIQLPFEWLKFASNALNPFRMVRIFNRILRIPIEWLEFECFELRWKDSNLDSNAPNLVQMVTICIRMLRIPFVWFELTFKCIEFLSSGSNLHLNAWNPF